MGRARLIALLFVLPLIIAASPPAQAAPSCQFTLGFATVHDLIPGVVGDCTEDQQYAANGDAVQHTTGGLLVWRKADNWTAFTDGYHTWINGPYGLQERLNSERFPWEHTPTVAPVVDPKQVLLGIQDVPDGSTLTHDGPTPCWTNGCIQYDRLYLTKAGTIQVDLSVWPSVQTAEDVGMMGSALVPVIPTIGDQTNALPIDANDPAYYINARVANDVVSLYEHCTDCGKAYTALARIRVMAGRLEAAISGQAPTSGVSDNWSGYEATAGDYSGVSATWTVPTPEFPYGPLRQAMKDGQWIGIGGAATADLIQVGTDVENVGDGSFRYETWVETLPQPPQPVPLVVHPGDSIHASLRQIAADTWNVALANLTTGQTYQHVIDYHSSASSVEWMCEVPLPHVPENYVTVQFSNASTVRAGQTLTVAQAQGRQVALLDSSNYPVAAPSALGGDGASFSVSPLRPTGWPS